MTSRGGPGKRSGRRSRKYWKEREQHAAILGARPLTENERRRILKR